MVGKVKRIRKERVKVSNAGHKRRSDKVHNSQAEKMARCDGPEIGNSHPG
jgi:hypothetical protein